MKFLRGGITFTNPAMDFLNRKTVPYVKNLVRGAGRFVVTPEGAKVINPAIEYLGSEAMRSGNVKNILIDDLLKNRPKSIDDAAKTVVKETAKAATKTAKVPTILGAVAAPVLGAAITAKGQWDLAKQYQNAQGLSDRDRKIMSAYSYMTAPLYGIASAGGGILGGLMGHPVIGTTLGWGAASAADALGKSYLRSKGIQTDLPINPVVVQPPQENKKEETKKETAQPPEDIRKEAAAALGLTNVPMAQQGPSDSVETYVRKNANPNVSYDVNGNPIVDNQTSSSDTNVPTNGQQVPQSTPASSNPVVLSPGPQPTNPSSTDMLATLILLANQGGGGSPFFTMGNTAGGAAPFNYNNYLTPMERAMMENIQNNPMNNPEELRRLVNDYYNQVDLNKRVSAYRQELGAKGDVPRDTTELERLLGENTFAKQLLSAQNELYNNVMARADAMRLSQQYGIPYSAVANNMASAMQWLINPYITNSLKRSNIPLETLQKMIENTSSAEGTQATERVKGEEQRLTNKELWGQYRLPIALETLKSLEGRTADTNLARRQVAYTNALIAQMEAKNRQYLLQIGMPADVAKALSSTLLYLQPNTPQYQQVMNAIMNLTGVDQQTLQDNLSMDEVNSGQYGWMLGGE